MHIQPFQAIYPDFRYITSVDGFFGRVKEDYPEFKQSGYFKKAAKEAFYVYEIQSRQRNHLGLLSLAQIADYLDGLIKIHENTLPAKEQQQTRLLLARQAQVKPVLLTCGEIPELNLVLKNFQKPDNLFYRTKFEDTDEVHSLWAVNDGKAIEHLTDLIDKEVPEAFIADGHHRSRTMANLFEQHQDITPNPYAQILVALFPKDQLEIHDYNRVVQGLPDRTIGKFLARVSAVCNIIPLDQGKKPEKKHQLTMFVNREWFQLEWRLQVLEKHASDPRLLDADLLDKYVFEDILHITDVRGDQRLKYVEGPAGIEGLQTKTLKNENRIGFCLYPVKLDDLLSVAREGGIMPPKSTWFEPRIKNGLVVLDLNLRP